MLTRVHADGECPENAHGDAVENHARAHECEARSHPSQKDARAGDARHAYGHANATGAHERARARDLR